jgi:hypothetical protein
MLFIDMLGFASLTRRFPDARHSQTFEDGDEMTVPAPSRNRFERFHSILELMVNEGRMSGGVTAMLFSDCAFLDLHTAERAAEYAATGMRHFIRSSVPVRMGIGSGTFHQMGYSMRSDESSTVTESLFMGTAVVHSHAAEQAGGKGMRIFLHPSMEPLLPRVATQQRVLPLVKPLSNARWELDYLEDPPPARAADKSSLMMANMGLYDFVASMRDRNAPQPVQRHYSDTLKALNQMCGSRGYYGVNLRRLKSDGLGVDF